MRAIIDHRYDKDTYRFQYCLFFIWLIFLVVPYFMQLFFLDHGHIVQILITICFVTQCIFFSLECIQMRVKGVKDYLSDKYNWTDISSFVVFLIYYLIRVTEYKKATVLYLMQDYWLIKAYDVPMVTETDKVLMILNCIIVTFMLFKLIQFMRTFEKTQLMTVLVGKVTSDLFVLLLFWFIWVFFFALISVVLASDLTENSRFHGTTMAG
jgi:hypothetical protein